MDSGPSFHFMICRNLYWKENTSWSAWPGPRDWFLLITGRGLLKLILREQGLRKVLSLVPDRSQKCLIMNLGKGVGTLKEANRTKDHAKLVFFFSSDLTTKSTALCMAKKRAHQRAVEAAFARIVLVTTPGGRTYADVNSTVEDTLEQAHLLSTDGVVKVRWCFFFYC